MTTLIIPANIPAGIPNGVTYSKATLTTHTPTTTYTTTTTTQNDSCSEGNVCWIHFIIAMILILFLVLIGVIFATRNSIFSLDPTRYGMFVTTTEGPCVPDGSGSTWSSDRGTMKVVQRCIPNPETQLGCLVLGDGETTSLLDGEYVTYATQFGTVPCEVAKVHSEWRILSETTCGVKGTDVVKGIKTVSRICTLVDRGQSPVSKALTDSSEPNYCIDNEGTLYNIGDIWVNEEVCFIDTNNEGDVVGEWSVVLPLSNKSPDFLGERVPGSCDFLTDIVPDTNCTPYDNEWTDGLGGFFDVLKEGAIYETMTCVIPEFLDDNGILVASMTYNAPTDKCIPADCTFCKIDPIQTVDGTVPEDQNPILCPEDAPECLAFCRVMPNGCTDLPERFVVEGPFGCLVGCFLTFMKGNRMLRQVGDLFLFIAPVEQSSSGPLVPVGGVFQEGDPIFFLLGPRELNGNTLSASFMGIVDGVELGWLKRVDVGGPAFQMGFEAAFENIYGTGVQSQNAELFDFVFDPLTLTYSLPLVASNGEPLDMMTIVTSNDVSEE